MALRSTRDVSMNFMSDRKEKEQLESSRQHISLGIPTKVPIGPSGFRAGPDLDPKDDQFVFPLTQTDPPDPGRDAKREPQALRLRIVSRDEEGEDTDFHSQGTRPYAVVRCH